MRPLKSDVAQVLGSPVFSEDTKSVTQTCAHLPLEMLTPDSLPHDLTQRCLIVW